MLCNKDLQYGRSRLKYLPVCGVRRKPETSSLKGNLVLTATWTIFLRSVGDPYILIPSSSLSLSASVDGSLMDGTLCTLCNTTASSEGKMNGDEEGMLSHATTLDSPQV